MLTHQHLKTTIAIVLALSAMAAPAATAMPLRGDPPCSGCGYAPSTIVRVAAPSGGFDWGDAGIGAAGVLAIALVALGLTLVVRSSRPAPAARRSRAPGM